MNIFHLPVILSPASEDTESVRGYFRGLLMPPAAGSTLQPSPCHENRDTKCFARSGVRTGSESQPPYFLTAMLYFL
jgi:hypothetical protein